MCFVQRDGDGIVGMCKRNALHIFFYIGNCHSPACIIDIGQDQTAPVFVFSVKRTAITARPERLSLLSDTLILNS
jgi:hypothetical protein